MTCENSLPGSTVDGGEWSALCTNSLAPKGRVAEPIEQEAGWAGYSDEENNVSDIWGSHRSECQAYCLLEYAALTFQNDSIIRVEDIFLIGTFLKQLNQYILELNRLV
jgi:hypothetical protein